MPNNQKIAVVALQGGFDKHIKAVAALGADAVEARLPKDFNDVDGIILPGGESTTIIRLLSRFGVDESIKQAHNAGIPIYGSCAGLIILSKSITADTEERGGQPTLGLLDVKVARNAFGRQIDSFEADLEIPCLTGGLFPAVFIRAPYIAESGANVETLCVYEQKSVLVRQGTILGSAFHPELTTDRRIHALFLSMIYESRS